MFEVSFLQFIQSWKTQLLQVGLVVTIIGVGLILHAFLFRLMRRIAKRTETIFDDSFIQHCTRPLRYVIPVLMLALFLPAFEYETRAFVVIENLFTTFLILIIAWFLVRLTKVFRDVLFSHFEIGAADNLRARKVYTQTELLRKILVIVIGVITVGAILMSHEQLSQLGTGLLASAGLAGLVIGFAAQKTIANLLSGFQIAITQPIRIDDVVIVENEWGRIEEITLTYVVVRIWDLRRLILPISYFLENPFQNWTRVSSDLLGTVYIYVDYSLPIEEMREELHRILEESEHWDGEVWRLHVTDTTEKTVELRALMSAKDSSAAWELRCEVREKLLESLKTRHPEGLPRIRAELEKLPEGEKELFAARKP